MKKISIILLVLLLNSCIREQATLTKFVVENNSEYEVKIHVSMFQTRLYSGVDTIF